MSRKNALIIDDEPDIRELLEITLIRMGIDTQSAETVQQAQQFLSEETFDLVLTDMNLPDGNGIDLVAHIQSLYPDTPVAMITAYGSVETAINALKAGAFDFISKPVDLNQLRDIVASALKLSESLRKNAAGPSEGAEDNQILGDAPAIKALNQQIAKLARSQAPIYIAGESGSGKELVARMIHKMGPRSQSPFVPVNCGAIPSELMESEFFGHRKGSFSGAHEDKDGLFKAAHGGTLFLDEVADLPLSMQVKLLRAIQEKAVRAVGAQNEEKIDVRILSATHKDLQSMVDSGAFRQDLFYRINVIKLEVPSLRDRSQDIPLLARQFLKQVSEACGVSASEPKPTISDEAMSALCAYTFPGNVRELENIIERAFTLCEQNIIQLEDLQLENTPAVLATEARHDTQTTQVTDDPSPEALPLTVVHTPASIQNISATPHTDQAAGRPEDVSLEAYLESIERTEIEAALQATKWNRTAAAKKLGISFRALRYRLKKLEMD